MRISSWGRGAGEALKLGLESQDGTECVLRKRGCSAALRQRNRQGSPEPGLGQKGRSVLALTYF